MRQAYAEFDNRAIELKLKPVDILVGHILLAVQDYVLSNRYNEDFLDWSPSMIAERAQAISNKTTERS